MSLLWSHKHKLKMTSYPDNWNDTVVRAYDEGFPLLMPRWGYVASAFVLFMIGFFGFFLNLMVILLMFKDRQLWTPLNIILFNLVCSDFSVSVLGNPFTLISALFHRWVFGKTMCMIYGFFMALLGIVSITTLTVLSFERYLIVTRPMSARHLSSKGAIMSVLFIWSYSLALTTPPLMGWGNYVSEAANISCSVNWHEQSRNTLTYILFLFAMGQIVPMVVISFSYINIIRTMKKNSKRLGRVSRAETRVTGMVFVMIISFTIAWTPYSVFALIEQFATKGTISPGVGVIPALVAKSSICYDPLIYVGMNSQFRHSIKRIFGIHTKGGLSQTERGYDNTLLSPSHKRSCDVTRFASSESRASCTMKSYNTKIINNEGTDTMKSESIMSSQRNLELKTIRENRTASDGERSDATIFENDSSNSSKKLELLTPPSRTVNCNSPVLTILDSETFMFNNPNRIKTYNEDEESNEEYDIKKSVFGNKAFEEYPDEEAKQNRGGNNMIYQGWNKENVIKHSYSLDLGGKVKENKNRKLSVDTKVDTLIQIKGFLKNTVVSKFFDQDSKQSQDICKSYLYVNKNINDDESL